MKIRFLEPGNRPYKPTPLNYFVYDRYIRTPSVGLNTLATIVKELVDDTYMYSESISRIDMDDVEDAASWMRWAAESGRTSPAWPGWRGRSCAPPAIRPRRNASRRLQIVI